MSGHLSDELPECLDVDLIVTGMAESRGFAGIAAQISGLISEQKKTKILR